MKKSAFSLIIALSTYLSPWAIAGNTSPSKVEQVLTTIGGAVFFKAGVQISPAPCSVANEWAFQVIGSNASGGKATLALLLEAQAANKNIAVYGTGVCDIISDRETVGYIVVY